MAIGAGVVIESAGGIFDVVFLEDDAIGAPASAVEAELFSAIAEGFFISEEQRMGNSGWGTADRLGFY